MTVIDHLGRSVGVVTLLSTLWALPASAEAVSAAPGASVAAESTTCTAELATLSDFDAMALAPKRKRKPLASVRTPPTRLAALSQPGWTCTGPSCGRHFVLMIGIGY